MASAMALSSTRTVIRQMMARRGSQMGKDLQVPGQSQQQVRTYYKGPIATPPMQYIPFWEKCVHFGILNVATFAYPLWVCYWSEWYLKKGRNEL